MWDGFNKRKFPRLNIHCEITVSLDNTKNSLHAYTENIGSGGVSVLLDEGLERFSLCKLKLDLGKNGPTIQGQGKVVWTIPVGDVSGKKKRFDTGIEFVTLETADREALQKLIEAESKRFGW